MRQAIVQMKVPTTESCDPTANNQVMVERKAPMAQVILVMIWAVLQPVEKEHRCIHVGNQATCKLQKGIPCVQLHQVGAANGSPNPQVDF